MHASRLVSVLSLFALAGCDWAAADGPWNGEPPTAVELVDATGAICAPDGMRGAPGLTVRWFDALDQAVLEETTDPWGRYPVSLPPARYTVAAGDGVFDALGVVSLDEAPQAPLCLQRSAPQALVLRTELASATDLIDARLDGLGIEHVHDGPTDATTAGQLLGSPAGLVDYGVLAVAGALDFDALAAEPGALDGLREFLGNGGGLYLSGEAWPLLELLAPGRIGAAAHTAEGFVEADVADATLALQLDHDTVGVRLHAGAVIFDEPSDLEVDVLLRGTVDGVDEPLPLLQRLRVEGGTVVLSSFLAPGPRPGEWWMGPPTDVLPDGSWDGRGAVLDRLILQM